MQFDEMLSEIKTRAIKDLLQLVWETGIRVQEVRLLEARFIDLEARRIVFPPSKSKGQKRSRIVYLGTEKAVEILRDACKRNPKGPVLRNSRGAPWSKDAINSVFERLQKKLGVKFHLGALRKGYATEAIKSGVDTVSLATLLGHSDTTMVSDGPGIVPRLCAG